MRKRQSETIYLTFPEKLELDREKVAKVVACLVKNDYVTVILRQPWFSDSLLIKEEVEKAGVFSAQILVLLCREQTDSSMHMDFYVWKTSKKNRIQLFPDDAILICLETSKGVKQITGEYSHSHDAKVSDRVIAHVEKLARQALGEK